MQQNREDGEIECDVYQMGITRRNWQKEEKHENSGIRKSEKIILLYNIKHLPCLEGEEAV